MDDNEDVDAQAMGIDAPPEIPSEQPPLPLTAEQVASGLSVLARTGNGLAHAFTKLELHGTSATSVEVLANYPHLRYVDLSENVIENADSIGKLEYLLSINLATNRLLAVPPALSTRQYLQQANFTKNYLKEVSLSNMPMLVHLILNKNLLTRVQLQSLPELQILEIRENKLEQIQIDAAPKLKHLHLSFNKLTSIEGLPLPKLPHLETVYLRNNQIASLSGFSVSNGKLANVNLRHNLIPDMAELDYLKHCRSLKSLNLSENPISQTENYRIEVLKRLPFLEKIDKDPVTPEEKKLAAAAAK